MAVRDSGSSPGSGRPSDEQMLKREFKLWSAFALPFAFISPIVALYSIFGLAFLAGGPAFWWTFLLALFGQLMVALTYAELASVWPLAGGIYQWSRHLMGNAYGWFAGYFYAWSLTAAMAIIAYGAATFLAALFGIAEPSLGTLVLLALCVLAFATFANTLGRGMLKVVASVAIACEVLGSLGVATILLLFFRENSPSVILDGFGTAGDGWYVTGPFLAAMAFVGWAFNGFESAGAIAEEVQNPSRDVPKAMLFALVCVALVVTYTAFALILAIPNIQAVLSGEVTDPVANTLATALGPGISKPLFVIIIIGFTASLMAIQTAVSRVIFAFARDGATPASGLLRRLSARDRLPINAIVFTAACTILAVFVFLASADIYGTVVTGSVGGTLLAFLFPAFAALVARLRGRRRSGQFSLGRWGLLVNVLAVTWLVFQVANLALPRTPELPWYQNYGVIVTVLVFGVLGILAFLPLRKQMSRRLFTSRDPLSDAVEERSAAREGGVAERLTKQRLPQDDQSTYRE